MIPPPGPVSPTLYTTTTPASVGEGDTSLLEADDPPLHETRTNATPVSAHLMDRICSPFVSSKQDTKANWNRSIQPKHCHWLVSPPIPL